MKLPFTNSDQAASGEASWSQADAAQAPSSQVRDSPALAPARRSAQQFGLLEQVEAVALSGSRSSETSDQRSDIDLYVYVTQPIALEARRQIAAGATRAEIGNEFWEPGDEWIDGESGIAVDVMYREVNWIRDQIRRVLVGHQASIGYTTCFWYNVLHSRALFDRSGWFAELQEECRQPYPAALKRAIVAKNYPILHRNQSSYLHQIELALERGDVASVHHRVAALLASYFDIVFAVNEQPHPGEKRLLWHATTLCSKLPAEMEQDVRAVLAGQEASLMVHLRGLMEKLDAWLAGEGMLPG